jgi:type I restriction-modification system DNA methylase subunit
MSAPEKLHQIVDRFHQNVDAYRSGRYNETQVRREFLDPFFKLLGWDVENEQGSPEAYKDVIHEDAIKIGGATKAPDYCFRTGGIRKFFVEAKKPAVDIRGALSPAFQLRRYAWSANLPLSILTDFEDFVVYDCRYKPDKNDKTTTARTLDYNYTEYHDRWDEIAGVFSREAVLAGSLDQYVASEARKGIATVDAEFLKEIETWRELLAKNIAVWNKELSQRDLNFAVQMTLDRIIFLRISEDRGIEPYERLKELSQGGQVYKKVCDLFRDADDRYNSGLFHFRREKDRPELPDDLTLSLTIDDEPLKKIIRSTYFPDSPYEFSVLPIEILGQVYEQFLGKVIHLTSSRSVKVEDKPEVRRAGGVYYTPSYIVDYIVEQTIGKLLEGKTPRQVENLRILDPACGSGSFLIGAYQYLLDWHRDWYTEHDTKKHKKELYQGTGDVWRLTTAERKRILLNNIYGVDIDSQAVEVTKLSLLLKVLEGESGQTLATQLRMFQERALPDLGNNIKCGNSLIASDFYDNQQMGLLTEEERYRINVFDWKDEFSKVMQTGGFDAVIGNPPYIRMETFVTLKEYLRRMYSVYDERTDLYAYIIEASLKLLRDDGIFSMIVSNKFVKANYGRNLRNLVRSGAIIERIVDFAGTPIFKGATVRTLILTLRKGVKDQTPFPYSPPPSPELFRQLSEGSLTVSKLTETHDYLIDPSHWRNEEWSFERTELQFLRDKLTMGATPLAEWLDVPICYGVKSGLVEAFIIDRKYAERVRADSSDSCARVIRPYVIGREVLRYAPIHRHNDIIYTPRGIDITNCHAILGHLQPFKQRLLKRATKQEWFELQQAQERYVELMTRPKIVYPDIAKNCRFTIDEEGHICGDTTFAIPLAHKGLLGLLNSRLALFYFQSVCAALEGAEESYLRFKLQYVGSFPIPKKFSTSADPIIKVVERILALHKELGVARTNQDRTVIQRQIEATDRQIDRLVFELYGLTEEEIKIVEEATR